ncbi:predicted protein [Nematostella vectensis]|uniref:Uncharacterized protein n=1 Tax=Nematostella vectensis TaxID=45351 RepID=A8DV25_NEMVE|nr:predicted protein [Nematostella vectensis]|eukprot:XP_001618615.1 hypothetical protein NEMVEDRAFT_v1g154045 [Nematostella vectensis]
MCIYGPQGPPSYAHLWTPKTPQPCTSMDPKDPLAMRIYGPQGPPSYAHLWTPKTP